MSELAHPSPVLERVAAATVVPAPLVRRAVAWLIDAAVVLAVLALEPWWSYALVIGLFVAYHGLSVWLVGQTPGKAVVGLRVERLSGDRTLLWSLGRAGIGYLVVDLLGVGALTALVDSQRRSAHDFVFGSRVVVVEDRKGLLARLEDFALRQKQAVARHKRPMTVLTAVLAWPLGLAKLLRRMLDVVTPNAHAPGKAPLKILSSKLTAAVAVAATATTALVVAYAPPARDAAHWLFKSRSFGAQAASVDALAGSWRADALAQVANDHWNSKDGLPAEAWRVERGNNGYRLVRPSQTLQLAGEKDGSYTATWSGTATCVDTPSAGTYRSSITLRLQPQRKLGDHVQALAVRLDERASAEDRAKAQAANCVVEGGVTYEGTATRVA